MPRDQTNARDLKIWFESSLSGPDPIECNSEGPILPEPLRGGDAAAWTGAGHELVDRLTHVRLGSVGTAGGHHGQEALAGAIEAGAEAHGTEPQHATAAAGLAFTGNRQVTGWQ